MTRYSKLLDKRQIEKGTFSKEQVGDRFKIARRDLEASIVRRAARDNGRSAALSPFGNPHVRSRVRSGIPQDSGLASHQF